MHRHMNQILRILGITFRFKDGNLRYKIAYLRTNYENYNPQTGDEIDTAIFEFFQSKPGTPQVRWEYVDIYNPMVNLSHILDGFSNKEIPLIISPKLDIYSLSPFEQDALVNDGVTYPIQNKKITLLYRSNMDENHPYWPWLPTLVQIEVDYKVYVQLAQTIFPY